MNNTSPVAFRQLATAAIGAVLHLLAQHQDAGGNINAIEQVGGGADAAALKKRPMSSTPKTAAHRLKSKYDKGLGGCANSSANPALGG